MGQAQPAPVYQEPEFQTDLPVGEILRRARLHYGQSLKDVEKNIRIRASQIEAIETGNYENLPGRVYAIGFVRSYAEYLGLDGGHIVSLFKAQSIGATTNPELHFPVPASESKLPSRWVLIGCSMGLILFCSYLYIAGQPQNTEIYDIPPVPGELREKAGLDNAGAPAVPEVIPPRFTPVAKFNAPSAPAPVEISKPVAGEPAAEPETATAAPAPAQSRSGITLNITENSWVEIKDAADKIIVSRVLEAGDQYYVPNRPDLQMALGNAGGVEIMIDGTALGKLGERGAVRREISLDADILRGVLENNNQN